MQKKTLVFVFRQSPAMGESAKEGLDALLAAAAFEQNVIPIFINQGVWQLQSDMSLDTLNITNIDKQLSALPLYDVNSLYVHRASFEKAGVVTQHKNIHWLDDDELALLLAQADQVFTF